MRMEPGSARTRTHQMMVHVEQLRRRALALGRDSSGYRRIYCRQALRRTSIIIDTCDKPPDPAYRGGQLHDGRLVSRDVIAVSNLHRCVISTSGVRARAAAYAPQARARRGCPPAGPSSQ